MGHLVNPVGMRIGKFVYWEDLLYKSSLYYPEFIHKIFKIKLFLTLFFCSEVFMIKDIIFSNCSIIYKNKSLLIKIFLYDSKLEHFLNTYNLEDFFAFEREGVKIDKSLKMLVFLNVIFKIKKKLLISLFNCVKKTQWKSQIKKNNLKKIIIFFKLFFFYLKIYSYKIIKFLLIKNFILIPYYGFVKKYIEVVLSYKFILKNIISRIYLISNKSLNATFFARFIAMKIQQGQQIKQVIKPIIKDILMINSRNIKYSGEKLKKNKLIFLKNINLFKVLVTELILNKYNELYTWYIIEVINLFKKYKINLFKKYKINLFKKYWNNYILYLYFFFKSDVNKESYQFWFNICESSKNSYFSSNSFNFILNQNWINITFFFKNFLKKNYINFFSFIKKKHIKQNMESLLLGFKFHFLGRFSRVQRASSKWYLEGKMPLNTMNAHIEYNYFIIPLFNSAVRIKVYIYRNKLYKQKVKFII